MCTTELNWTDAYVICVCVCVCVCVRARTQKYWVDKGSEIKTWILTVSS